LPFQKFIDNSSISVGISLFPIVFSRQRGKKGIALWGIISIRRGEEEKKSRRRRKWWYPDKTEQ
jgi:hypothetical protein